MKDISLHILDIVQNSVVAKATLIEIDIFENIIDDKLEIKITDNGIGMNQETVKKVLDPFFTTRKTRNVGLGLSLMKANCLNTGGSFEIDSIEGEGTTVNAVFIYSNIDRPPLGNIPQTITTILMSEEPFDLILTYSVNNEEFKFSTIEIKEMLDNDIDFKNFEISNWIESFIEENINSIK